jgi:RHS repeat-associated protein
LGAGNRRLRAIFFLCFASVICGYSVDSSAQIALDGANHCSSYGTSVTSVSCTLPSVTAGDLITVEFSDRNGYETSVSDASNGAYTQIYYVADSGDPNYSGMAYFVSSGAGSTTVQLSLSWNDPWAVISVQAWKGASKNSVLDASSITQQQTSVSGTMANANCGTAQSPVGSGELIIAYLVPDGDFSVTAGTNYTLIDVPNSPDNPAFPEYWIQSSAQSTNGPFTSAADDFTEGCAAFRPFGPPAAGTIITIAGNGYYNNNGDGGSALNASLEEPGGVTVDSSGNVYVSDFQGGVVRKVSASTGVISTIAGSGTSGYSGDGGAAISAQLDGPTALAVDSTGNLYIADTWNSRIRKVNVSTGIITTVAGTVTDGYTGDGGPATSAEICQPSGIAVDGAGNLYIADSANSVIREVSASTGIITTVVNSSAALSDPAGIALDSSGHLYIADFGSNLVRQWTISTGSISTVAGNGTAGYSGNGGSATSAELNWPTAVAVDGNGNIFIAERDNHVIRSVSRSSGTITTVAGNNTAGYSGDGGPATSAQLNYPEGVALDAAGNVYIGDSSNHRVREVGQVSISVSPATAILSPGQAAQFAATVSNSSNSAVTWSVSPSGTGNISTNGLYTAPAIIAAQQSVTVTATSQAEPTKSASATVTLEPTVSVSVNPSTATLIAGQQQTFNATVSNSSNTAVTWSISPAGTGTITSGGLYTAPSTVAGQQTITVTATSLADTSKSASAALLLVPGGASCNYSYVRTVTIDHTKVANTDQTNFPFLFSTIDPLLKSTSNGGHVANPNGYDIIFSLDPFGATKLDHELEKYDPATGTVLAWIRIPTLSHTSNTTLYVFYGNSNITASQQNASGVWDSNYLGVWHLPNGTTLSANDSTANGYNGTPSSGVSAASGIIDGGASFNGGSSAFISLPGSSTAWNFPADLTVSAWIKTSGNGMDVLAFQNSNPLVYLGVGPLTVGGSSNKTVAYFRTDSGYVSVYSGNKTINDNNWHNIQAARVGTAVNIYVDGVLDSSGGYFDGDAIDIAPSGGSIGGLGSSYNFNGLIDEVHVSNVSRSPDWIATEFSNQNAPSKFYAISSESPLAITPQFVSLHDSGTQQFSASVLGACSTGISWSENPAGVGSLSSSGLYSAPSPITAPQTVLVTAASQADPTKTATANVTLVPEYSPSLTLTASNLPPYVTGESPQFVATLTNRDGTPLAYTAVSFTVTGANATSGSGTTNANGIATFTYTGLNNGNDSIQALVTVGSQNIPSNSLTANWVTATAVVSTTDVLAEFFPFVPGTCCTFNATPAMTPAWSQVFPSINFNPPAGAIPGNTTVGVNTTPFTDVTVDANGNFSGTIVAQGNGLQAWTGSVRAFQVVLRGSLIVKNGGDLVIPIYVDNGFTLGIGGGATLISGPSGGPQTTAFENYPVMGTFYTSIGGAAMTVHFPAAGTYPYEVDFAEDGQGSTSLMMMTGSLGSNGLAPGVPSGGTLTLTPGTVQAQPVGGTQSFTVVAKDPAGNPVPNLSIGLVVTQDDTYDLTATPTDATGTTTVQYLNNSGPGTDQVQAVAIIDGTITYSNQVSVPWTQAAGNTSGSGSGSGSGASLSVSISAPNTIILPNSLQLSGSATDTSLPSGNTISYQWSEIGGQGTVTFANSQQASTSASFSQPGTYQLKLSVNDINGAASAQITVAVDQATTDGGWIGAPANQSQVSGIVPISVASGVTLTSGVLTVYPASNPNAITVLNSNTTGSGQIGTWDTTQIPNGSYWITLQATTSSGQSQYNLALVTVVGNYKPGRITSTVTDLVVPAKGLAIQIQRTYDSLNAATSSDFGYGWNLGTNVNLSVNPLGSVTFTLGGQRRTFYLTPQYSGFLPFYVPAFTPEPGMHGTLINAGSGCSDSFDYLVPDGSLWACVGGGLWTPPGYVYTDPSGTAYTMTSSGQLQSIVDKNGNALTITAAGITSSTGLSVPFIRDSSGRITKITDPQGNNYLYAYDLHGNLESVTYPNTTQASTYTYDSSHRYLSGTDFRNNPLPATTYDASGRLQSVTDGLGETTSYAYDLTTNTTSITYPPDAGGNVGTATMVYDTMGDLLTSTDPLGHTTTNTFDSNQNLLSTTDPLNHITCYTYDANGNRTSVSLPQTGPTCSAIVSTTAYNQYSEPTQTVDELGNVRTFNYDVNFNPQSVTDGLGTLASFVFDNDGTMQAGAIGFDISANPSMASQFTYDSGGNMASRTDALGRTTSYTYNSLGQEISMVEPLPPGISASAATTAYTYDAFGNLTQTAAPLGRTTGSTYDANGNKLTDTDARGNITSYAYDALNRLSTTTYPTSPATAFSKTYDFRSNVVTETDQAGHVTKHTYDLAGHQTSVTQAYGTSNATTTTYAYDGAGRMASMTDALGNTTAYTYDAAGNLLSVTTGYGTSNASTTSYTYDSARNRTSMTDGNGNMTYYAYDARKRLIVTTFSATASQPQTTRTNTYDGPGNLTSVTDQNGNIVQYAYDAANQLQSVTQTSSPNTPNYVTSYGYNVLGDITGLTDANSHLTENAFDLLSQPISKTLPDGSLTETRQYDPAGNLTSLTHFNGKTTTYSYDTLNRLLSRTPDSTTGEPTVSFTYTATGKRASMADASGTTNYTYDSMDRLITKATPEGTLIYSYDAAGHLASMTSSHTNGISVSYTYDSLNRLSTVVDSRLSGNQTTTYTYDDASNVATVTYPNSVQTALTYDQLNRLKQLATSQTGYLYTFDNAGNRKSATELNGRSVAWNFDDIYRLTSESITGATGGENGSASYGLDPVGNRLSATSSIPGLAPVAGTLPPDDHLSSESYDSDGNVTASGGKTFTYDTENHLMSMNGGAVTIVYDGDGNRVAKTVSGVTTRYLVDDLNPTGYAQVVEELSSGGSVQRQYTYGLQRISENQLISNTWTPSFYGYDGFGTVRQLTNYSAGTITDSYDYDAFGNLLNPTSNGTPNNYLYRGEQWDKDLGLYYLRARYYNPLTGRFMSRDPNEGNFKDPQSLHKYLYAGGDPINVQDPTGRSNLSLRIRGAALEYALIVAIVAPQTIPILPAIPKLTCTIFKVVDDILTIETLIDINRGKEGEGPSNWDLFWREASWYCDMLAGD